MKVLIVYNSLTGFTKRYAEKLAEILKERGAEAELEEYKKFKPKRLRDCDKVVFMARVTNNNIDGFKTVVKYAEAFAEKFASVAAVGMFRPTPDRYHALEYANIPYKLKGIPLFLLQGGFDAEKLTGRSKLMIKLMRMQLTRAQSRSPEEMATLNFLSARTDKTDFSQLDPIADYLFSGVFNPPPPPADDEEAEGGSWMDLDEYMPKSLAFDEAPKQEEGDKPAQKEGGGEEQDSVFAAGRMKE